ncbi:MAG: AAA family ATPase, partial [Actinomycetota bacterium]
MAVTASPGDAELRRATVAKTTPPLSPPWLLDRIALRRRLDDCMERRLTVVLAEAGFGKSTLLADWASTNRCAWYTLDPRDATLTSLFRGIVDALRLRVPDLPGDLATAIERAGGPDLDREVVRAHGCASLLADALQDSLQRDLALVLDDVQEATAGSGAVALIEALSRQAPPRLHVVLSSRAEPPFAIDRMRGQGQVLE